MDKNDIGDINLNLGISSSILKRIHHFPSLDSTNSYLKRNLDKYSSGDIVLADLQSQGKGRMGRAWSSDSKGGLYFSILLKNKWDLRDLNFITLLLATSIDRALKNLGFNSLIKWPNDIYLHGKKLAGILVENIIKEENNTILGMGINVNNKDFKADLLDKATSLYLEGGPVDKKALFASILENLDQDLETYSQDFKKENFVNYIKENSLNLNKDIKLQVADKIIQGRMEDILADGSLKILDKNNHSHLLNYGEIINQ